MTTKHIIYLYHKFLYTIGLTTSLLCNVFAVPFCINIIMSLFLLSMFFVSYFLFSVGVGIVISLLAFVILTKVIVAILTQKSVSIGMLLLLNTKAILIAIFIVICYSIFNMPLSALFLGFTIPLCIISICQVTSYIQKTNSIEGL